MDRINSNAVYEIAKANERLAKRIEELEKELEHYRWIPVVERLPEEPEPETDPEYLPEYIVMISGAQLPTVLSYEGKGKWWHAGDDAYYPIVAWIPMPEPYRPEVLREAGADGGAYADAPVVRSAT